MNNITLEQLTAEYKKMTIEHLQAAMDRQVKTALDRLVNTEPESKAPEQPEPPEPDHIKRSNAIIKQLKKTIIKARLNNLIITSLRGNNE